MTYCHDYEQHRTSADVVALREERDAALARVRVLERALRWAATEAPWCGTASMWDDPAGLVDLRVSEAIAAAEKEGA